MFTIAILKELTIQIDWVETFYIGFQPLIGFAISFPRPYRAYLPIDLEALGNVKRKEMEDGRSLESFINQFQNVILVSKVFYHIKKKKMCDLIWYGMVWYGMVWYGMVWYGKG